MDAIKQSFTSLPKSPLQVTLCTTRFYNLSNQRAARGSGRLQRPIRSPMASGTWAAPLAMHITDRQQLSVPSTYESPQRGCQSVFNHNISTLATTSLNSSPFLNFRYPLALTPCSLLDPSRAGNAIQRINPHRALYFRSSLSLHHAGFLSGLSHSPYRRK